MPKFHCCVSGISKFSWNPAGKMNASNASLTVATGVRLGSAESELIGITGKSTAVCVNGGFPWVRFPIRLPNKRSWVMA
jgi:hypothetical protein